MKRNIKLEWDDKVIPIDFGSKPRLKSKYKWNKKLEKFVGKICKFLKVSESSKNEIIIGYNEYTISWPKSQLELVQRKKFSQFKVGQKVLPKSFKRNIQAVKYVGYTYEISWIPKHPCKIIEIENDRTAEITTVRGDVKAWWPLSHLEPYKIKRR